MEMGTKNNTMIINENPLFFIDEGCRKVKS